MKKMLQNQSIVYVFSAKTLGMPLCACDHSNKPSIAPPLLLLMFSFVATKQPISVKLPSRLLS